MKIEKIQKFIEFIDLQEQLPEGYEHIKKEAIAELNEIKRIKIIDKRLPKRALIKVEQTEVDIVSINLEHNNITWFDGESYRQTALSDVKLR